MINLVDIFNTAVKKNEPIKFNNQGYYIHKASSYPNPKISVVIPIYNSEKTLQNCIDSVITQSLSKRDIELILVDDQSTDNSKNIILRYCRLYQNITAAFLEKNSGTPAKPRNIGIDLARGEFLTFLDADDWLHEDGLKCLYNLAKKANTNYAVGKTIKVTDKTYKIVGEYNNWVTRETVDPSSINHVFQHLAPTGRIIKTDFVRKHNIRFPHMVFAEDKQFFFDVLINCDQISTSSDIVYFANRRSDNKSFTTTTSLFDKADANIALIEYVTKKDIPDQMKRMMLRRLYEFDGIGFLFNRKRFLYALNKKKFYDKFSETLSRAENLPFDVKDTFLTPWNKLFIDLFRQERYSDIEKLILWIQTDSFKDFIIKDNKPFYVLPIENPNYVEANMLALFHSKQEKDEDYLLRFNIYSRENYHIGNFVLRDRTNELKFSEFDVQHVEDCLYEVKIPYHRLENLDSSSYAAFIRYNGYEKAPIKMNVRNIIKNRKKQIDFYTTIADNFGVKID